MKPKEVYKLMMQKLRETMIKATKIPKCWTTNSS